MSRRTVIVLWAAVSVAVLLLGSGVATAQRLSANGGVSDYVVLFISLSGAALALTAAGRIAWILGKSTARRRSHGPGVESGTPLRGRRPRNTMRP